MRARDLMEPDVEVVRPDTRVTDLEEKLLRYRHGGFPVVEGGKLVGLVSRSDIVRALQVQQAWEHELEATEAASEADRSAVTAARAAARFANETVADIMTREVTTVAPDAPLETVAGIFVDRHIHRLPVVEAGRVVGMVTTLDIARLIADGRYIPE